MLSNGIVSWLRSLSSGVIGAITDNEVLFCSQHPDEDLQPILYEENEITVAAMKTEKSIGVDNMQEVLFKRSETLMLEQ